MATDMDEVELRRVRMGIVILVTGILLILWAWGNWVYRAWSREPAAAALISEEEGADDMQETAANLLSETMIYTMVLVLVAMFGGYYLVRATRRYREGAQSKAGSAEAATDLWAAHKVPELNDEE